MAALFSNLRFKWSRNSKICLMKKTRLFISYVFVAVYRSFQLTKIFLQAYHSFWPINCLFMNTKKMRVTNSIIKTPQTVYRPQLTSPLGRWRTKGWRPTCHFNMNFLESQKQSCWIWNTWCFLCVGVTTCTRTKFTSCWSWLTIASSISWDSQNLCMRTMPYRWPSSIFNPSSWARPLPHPVHQTYWIK